MYITSDDLKAILTEDEIITLQRKDETDEQDKTSLALNTSENYIRDSLGSKYDIDKELARTGANRKQTLVNIALHIAVWELCQAFPFVTLDDKRHYNFETAKADLERIRQGKLLTTLDNYIDEETVGGLPQSGISDNNELTY